MAISFYAFFALLSFQLTLLKLTPIDPALQSRTFNSSKNDAMSTTGERSPAGNIIASTQASDGVPGQLEKKK